MDNFKKWITAGIVLNLIFSIVILTMVVTAKNPSNSPSNNIGISGMKVEDYIPLIRQNGGYFSSQPIYTESTIRADGTLTLGGSVIINGLTLTVFPGTFNSASTTVFSFQPSTSATSSCTMKIVEVTGISTTTLIFTVATSTSNSITGVGIVGGAFIDFQQLATSTKATYLGGVKSTANGSASVGSNPEVSVMVSPNEYIVGYASTSQAGGLDAATEANGFLGDSSTWAGTYNFICHS